MSITTPQNQAPVSRTTRRDTLRPVRIVSLPVSASIHGSASVPTAILTVPNEKR